MPRTGRLLRLQLVSPGVDPPLVPRDRADEQSLARLDPFGIEQQAVAALGGGRRRRKIGPLTNRSSFHPHCNCTHLSSRNLAARMQEIAVPRAIVLRVRTWCTLLAGALLLVRIHPFHATLRSSRHIFVFIQATIDRGAFMIAELFDAIGSASGSSNPDDERRLAAAMADPARRRLDAQIARRFSIPGDGRGNARRPRELRARVQSQQAFRPLIVWDANVARASRGSDHAIDYPV